MIAIDHLELRAQVSLKKSILKLIYGFKAMVNADAPQISSFISLIIFALEHTVINNEAAYFLRGKEK